MTPEAKVKKKVYKILRDNGAYYFSPIMSGYGKFFLTLASGGHTLIINENNILAVQDLLNIIK